MDSRLKGLSAIPASLRISRLTSHHIILTCLSSLSSPSRYKQQNSDSIHSLAICTYCACESSKIIVLLQTWITFEFASRVSLASVTLHYYCTRQSPQLQLSDGSGVVAPPVSPPCDSTAQRQCVNVSTSTRVVYLKVLRNNDTIYISEVKFFAGQPHIIIFIVNLPLR